MKKIFPIIFLAFLSGCGSSKEKLSCDNKYILDQVKGWISESDYVNLISDSGISPDEAVKYPKLTAIYLLPENVGSDIFSDFLLYGDNPSASYKEQEYCGKNSIKCGGLFSNNYKNYSQEVQTEGKKFISDVKDATYSIDFEKILVEYKNKDTKVITCDASATVFSPYLEKAAQEYYEYTAQLDEEGNWNIGVRHIIP